MIVINAVTNHMFFNDEYLEPYEGFVPGSANVRVAGNEVTSVLDLAEVFPRLSTAPILRCMIPDPIEVVSCFGMQLVIPHPLLILPCV